MRPTEEHRVPKVIAPTLKRKIAKLGAPMVVAGAIVASSTWADTITTTSDSAIYPLIDALIASPPVDHHVVEHLTGAELALVSEGVFDYYEAHDFKLKDATTIKLIDYRESFVARGAKAGSLLALTLDGACIALDEVLQRYLVLTISEIPSPHSRYGETYYSRDESWGTLSFGFPENSPGCLKAVVFSLRLPNETPSFQR